MCCADRPDRGRFDAEEAAAFDEFVRDHRDALVRVALATLGPGASNDAEDMAQEVLLRTFRRRTELRSPAALRSWLARSTVHAAISHRRRACWSRPHLPLEGQPDEAVGVRSPPSAGDRALRAQVMTLPDHERVVVHLHYWMGYTTGEIAGLLGCAEVTVRSRLLRARRRLHRGLQSPRHPTQAPPTEAEGRTRRDERRRS